jgi:hypothetical protein
MYSMKPRTATYNPVGGRSQPAARPGTTVCGAVMRNLAN